MNIIKKYSAANPYYRNNARQIDSRYTTFQQRGPIGLMLHSVGCPQPMAEVFARQWNSASAEVAVHAVLQADGTVYQCLPWNYRGIHCGGSANNTHVGVEMTEPACIRYTSGANFTCSNLTAAKAQAKGCYETAVQLFAKLCTEYHLDPLKAICSHAEGYQRGIASGHGDPEHLWRGLGLSYTMDTFRRDVKQAMQPQELYRIRKSWDDAQSQIGAYRDLQVAIACCRPGYTVYDSQGRVQYTAPEEVDMTKAEVIKLIDERIEAALAGRDTTPSNWAKDELARAVAAGITDGTRPGGYAKREEVAAMVLRAKESQG